MISQKSLKKSFLICMINTEMDQFMLKNGCKCVDTHFYTCILNGLVLKDQDINNFFLMSKEIII